MNKFHSFVNLILTNADGKQMWNVKPFLNGLSSTIHQNSTIELSNAMIAIQENG